MSAQQQQASSDCCCLAAQKLGVVGGLIDSDAHVSVTKTVQGELPPINDDQELSIGLSKGVERPVAPAISANPLAYSYRFLGQRSRNMHCRQRGQIAIGRGSAHLCAPMQVGHTAPQNTPLVLASRVVFGAPPDSKVLRLVDRRLAPKHASFVVGLERVLIEPVFDSHPIGTAPSISLHLVVGLGTSGAPHKAQHLLAPKTHYGMMHQSRINAFQSCPVPEHHIGSILAFGGCPVVVALNGPGYLAVQGMAQFDQGSHQLGPVSAVLFIQQCLGARYVSQPAKRVVLPAVGQPRRVHLTCQPLSTIETDLHEKGKPSLQPDAQPAHLLMDQIEIKVDTFTPLQLEFELLGGIITTSKPSPTGFDATDDRHQSRTNALALFDLQSDFLFVRPAGVQINHRPVMLFGQSCPGLAYAVGKADGEGFKVLPQDTSTLEVILHNRGIVETAQRALKPEPVPAVQDANDIGLVALCKKSVFIRVHPWLEFVLISVIRGLALWLRLCRAGSIRG